MEIKEVQSKKLFKEFSIEIPGNEIEEKINLKIKELIPKTNLPGFRPGKAPLNIVKKKYEKDVLGEVINNTVQESSKKLLNDKKIKPLRMPKIEIKKFDRLTSLEFIIKIDLPPEINLCDFNKIDLTKYEINISRSENEKAYKDFVDGQKNYISIKDNRAVKNHDKVLVSLFSNDNEVPEVLKKQDNVNVMIGSSYQFLPELDKKLVEKKVKKNDEVNVIIELPDKESPNKKNKFNYNIKILDIQESRPIKVDSEFLKKINIKSLNDLRKKIENDLKSYYISISDEVTKKNLLDNLEKIHKFDIPEGIYNEEFDSIWKRVEQAKLSNSLDQDDVKLNEQELKKRYEKIAVRRVKLALIVSFIAEKNNIEINNEELSNGIIQYSKNYPGQEKQIFEYFKKNPAEIEVIRGPLFEKKVIDHIISKANKINKKVSIKEILEIQSKAFMQK
tara:strand:+ start:2437 stop:3777 length:1341 start_codon:yes stop_codon:yes gene_type:complete